MDPLGTAPNFHCILRVTAVCARLMRAGGVGWPCHGTANCRRSISLSLQQGQHRRRAWPLAHAGLPVATSQCLTCTCRCHMLAATAHSADTLHCRPAAKSTTRAAFRCPSDRPVSFRCKIGSSRRHVHVPSRAMHRSMWLACVLCSSQTDMP
jgi:hypothetical protein